MHWTVLALAVFLGLHSFSEARGCIPPGPCGKVINQSPWPGKWADLGGGKHECHVYNWNNGKGSVGWSEKRGVNCTQHDFGSDGATAGGLIELTDVDGITFHDRRWR